MAVIDDIKNNALLHVGAEIVESFPTDSTDKKVITCNQLYPSVKNDLLSIREWTFAFKKASMGTKTSLTNKVYLYSYDIPAEVTNFLRFFHGDNSRAVIQDYQIREGKIFTNSTDLWAEYMYNVDESKYYPSFIKAFEYALAAQICFKLTGDKVREEQLHQKAWGLPSDNLKGGLVGVAVLTDQKQQPTKIIKDSPLLIARNAGVK
jgi:hypothetical protein